MEREIKFRGKSIESGEWIYGSLMKHQLFLDVRYYIKDSEKGQFVWHHVSSESIGQFTGVLDKNKSEIYEGDALRIGDENDGEINPNDSNTGIGAVIFTCGLWYVDSPINNGLWDLKQSYTDIEIVGNIHDSKVNVTNPLNS